MLCIIFKVDTICSFSEPKGALPSLRQRLDFIEDLQVKWLFLKFAKLPWENKPKISFLSKL